MMHSEWQMNYEVHTHTEQMSQNYTQFYIAVEIYRIAGKFDGELNLANWRFWTATVKV